MAIMGAGANSFDTFKLLIISLIYLPPFYLNGCQTDR